MSNRIPGTPTAVSRRHAYPRSGLRQGHQLDFSAREFGVEVWAVDETVSPSDNEFFDAAIGIVDIGFTREVPTAANAPEYPRPEFAEHWSYVQTMG